MWASIRQSIIRECWRAERRFAPLCWYLDRLGAERSALLAALPQQYWFDAATLVTHGSPRHIPNSIGVDTSDEQLQAMFAASAAQLAFVGHTHQTDGPRRGRAHDRRAAYILATRLAGAAAGSWGIAPRRVAYNIEATIAAYDEGLRKVAPAFCAVMARKLLTGCSLVGPWLRLSDGPFLRHTTNFPTSTHHANIQPCKNNGARDNAG